MTATHIHVTPTITMYGGYILPRGIEFINKFKEPIEALKEKSIDHIFTFLSTPGHTITTEDSPTHLDNQTSGPKNCFNLQLQMNGKGKTTVAQALLHDDLKDICCPTCKSNVVEVFFKAINQSFEKSQIATMDPTHRGPLQGTSFIITPPCFKESEIKTKEPTRARRLKTKKKTTEDVTESEKPIIPPVIKSLGRITVKSSSTTGPSKPKEKE